MSYYYESPQKATKGDVSQSGLFLAGGITDCPNWQKDIREALTNTDLVLLNPRRDDFPIDDPNAAQEQIAWEHLYLARARGILFWFPCETMCPIVLFELGAWAKWRDHNNNPKPIFVGVHPDYSRRQDVEIQLKLERPEVTVVTSLAELSWQVEAWEKSLSL